MITRLTQDELDNIQKIAQEKMSNLNFFERNQRKLAYTGMVIVAILTFLAIWFDIMPSYVIGGICLCSMLCLAMAAFLQPSLESLIAEGKYDFMETPAYIARNRVV